MKNVLKAIGWFIQGLCEEFFDWSKYIVACSLSIVILFVLWHGSGVFGKIAVGSVVAFVIFGAISKVWNKFMDQKIERQRKEIIAQQAQFNKLHEDLAEMNFFAQFYSRLYSKKDSK
jgi:uncharacterized membrane protein YczE